MKDAQPTAASERPRSSQSPRAPSSSRPSLSPRARRGAWRAVVGAAWVASQLALVVTADRRLDGAFGFRSFSESGTLEVALYREVPGEGGARERVHVDDGVWSARDAGGLVRRFAWTDRVRRRDLASFDVELSATYSIAAHVARLRAALDDVATHTGEDAETLRLLLDVTVRSNGREPRVVHLASAERPGGGR